MRLFVLVATVSATLSSQALVLGELKGNGQFNSTLSLDSNTTQSSSTCTMAYNIVETENKWGVSFSVITCNGLDTWNDVSLMTQVRGRDLFFNDKKVGTLTPDGGTFTLTSSTPVRIQDVTYDFNCKASGFETRTVNLQNSMTYTIQKLGDNHYSISRSQQYEFVGSVLNTQRPQCTYYVSKLGQRRTELKGEVKLSK